MKRELLLILVAFALLSSPNISFGQAPNLGTASGFALFTANGALSNSGASTISGDIGTNVGTISGFGTATITGSTRAAGSSQSLQAASDVVSAYNSLTSAICSTTIAAELGGQTLTPGVSCQNTAAATSLNGVLTLSGAGVFIIQLNSALTTATNSSIVLTNGATTDKVFFQINGAVTLGTGSLFLGTILALDAIVLNTQASLEGRALSIAGAITLNNNIVTNSALTLTVLAGPCDPSTNQYSLSGTLSLTNAVAGTATLTDGTFTATVPINAGDTLVAYSLTGLTAGASSHTVTVSYMSNINSATYTAPASCITAPASLSGIAFVDNNADGIQDGSDTPIEGVEVTLYTNGVMALATTTDVSGLYSFTGLTPGSSISYAVGFTTPSGLTATLADQGGDDALDSDADLITGRTQSVTLGPGENNPDLDAGFYAICSVITPTVTVGSCLTVTNTFSSTVVVTVNNPVSGQTLTITDGVSSQPFTTTAGTSNTFTMVINGLPSDGSTRTITATLPGCSSTTAQYSAPVSCSVVPPVCSIATPALTVGPCFVATDTYSATVVVTLSNTIGGVLTVSNGVLSLTTNVAGGLSTFPFTVVFNGLPSNGSTQSITASLPGCGSITTTYTAPASCSAGSPVNPMLELKKLVNRSTAIVGDTLTYSLVLTNIGSTSAAVIVRDSLSIGSTYIPGSATAPAGTTFTPGLPESLWTILSIAAGQSLTLTFQVRIDSTGILYNKASIPANTATVCTSVPIKLCPGDEYTLTASAGRASYAWYRNGVLITGATTNSLTVTQGGSYSLSVSGAGSSCPDFSCCPVIVEVDSLPSFTAAAIRATCVGNTPQSNGGLVISGFNPTHTYQYSTGATFNPAASLSGSPQVIPAGGVLVSDLVSPANPTTYTVRVYNSSGCYVDQTVILIPTVCGCPVEICVPYVVSQTKRAVRLGDPR